MTHSRKRSNIVPLTADPRAKNALKYRPEYCEIVKRMAREGQFPEAWCSEMGVSMSTMYNWAARYPEFDEACCIAWTALAAYWTGKAVRMAFGGEGDAKPLIRILRTRFPDTWGDNPRNTAGHYEHVMRPGMMELMAHHHTAVRGMTKEQIEAELAKLREHYQGDAADKSETNSK
ncbi:hypothetical protein [Primorskyibacter flagellatus]|uniref:Terminase small subunit n=1 Tax=Primorskyibacter flagellatus TaxID=1387277 RepID=A0A1W2E5R4_9RHOB|nr:hypothetical protein [Primorskyibacter flagellatus]SMD05090.1 hypothetical protein SAMN06295998_12311 [Primorskyibacter flagellatus]